MDRYWTAFSVIVVPVLWVLTSSYDWMVFVMMAWVLIGMILADRIPADG